MQDFVTWPLFLSLLISFVCLLLGKAKVNVFNIKLPYYRVSKTIIFLVAIGIAISLYHDSTDVLSLYF